MAMRPKTAWTSVERRKFLEYSWNTAAAGIALALFPGDAQARRRLSENPFTLGVASGDPSPSGIVLWTRLAPEPTEPKALGRAPIPVRWRCLGPLGPSRQRRGLGECYRGSTKRRTQLCGAICPSRIRTVAPAAT